jgi:hypothetical protein
MTWFCIQKLCRDGGEGMSAGYAYCTSILGSFECDTRPDCDFETWLRMAGHAPDKRMMTIFRCVDL